MVDAVPRSIEDLYLLWDRIIDRQISIISRGRCQRDERSDIKQEVYLRVTAKDFLGRTSALFNSRGGGCFERSLMKLTRSVTCNHFEKNSSRALNHVTRELPLHTDDQLLSLVRQGARDLVEANFARQVLTEDSLDKFEAWLQSPRGQYAASRTVPATPGTRVRIGLAEVFRLWRLFGESRSVTREIAEQMHVSQAWIRHLKQLVVQEFKVFSSTKH
jgi:hypothetical protein